MFGLQRFERYGRSCAQHAGATAVPSGLVIQTIANVASARELVALPNGDLLVGTGGSNVYVVPNAEGAGRPRVRHTFLPTSPMKRFPRASLNGGDNAEGVAFASTTCTVFIATEYHVWSIALSRRRPSRQRTCRRSQRFARVRPPTPATVTLHTWQPRSPSPVQPFMQAWVLRATAAPVKATRNAPRFGTHASRWQLDATGCKAHP